MGLSSVIVPSRKDNNRLDVRVGCVITVDVDQCAPRRVGDDRSNTVQLHLGKQKWNLHHSVSWCVSVCLRV